MIIPIWISVHSWFRGSFWLLINMWQTVTWRLTITSWVFACGWSICYLDISRSRCFKPFCNRCLDRGEGLFGLSFWSTNHRICKSFCFVFLYFYIKIFEIQALFGLVILFPTY